MTVRLMPVWSFGRKYFLPHESALNSDPPQRGREKKAAAGTDREVW